MTDKSIIRLIQYGVVFIFLLVFYAWNMDSLWVGSKQIHTLMELTAMLLALFIGVLSLIRFYSKKNNTFLFFGAGYLGVAFLDGYHAIVTSTFFDQLFPSVPASLIPWSWNASRYFLSVLMFLSYLAWRRQEKRGKEGVVSERWVYIGVTLFALASFAFFAFVPLPRAYYPELPFGRPEEFGAAILFLLALVGYLKKGAWRKDHFEHWVVLSLIVGFVSQVVFMPFSFGLFDFQFDWAHLLKKISYVCVLIGLFISMHLLFKRGEEDKKRAAENLKDMEKFRMAVDNASEQIVITDPQGIILYANKATKIISGYSPSEFIEKKAGTKENWGGLMKKNFYNEMWQTIKKEKKVFSGEVKNRRKNGNVYDAKISISPILDKKQNVLFFVAIERDITHEKEIDQAKTEFVSLASHQLRTPLTAISWYADILQDENSSGTLNKEQRLFLQEIRHGNNRMVQLVNALLSATRLEMGTTIIELEPVDITTLLNDIIKEVEQGYQGEQPELTTECKEDLPLLNIDRNMLEIILQNLITNAVKYTLKNKNVHIAISQSNKGKRIGKRAIKKKSIIVSVKDEGFGIPSHQQDQIFSKLFRADNVRQKDTDGTGLGLYIVKSILDQIGGEIWFSSEEDRGTTFTVVLPLDYKK